MSDVFDFGKKFDLSLSFIEDGALMSAVCVLEGVISVLRERQAAADEFLKGVGQ